MDNVNLRGVQLPRYHHTIPPNISRLIANNSNSTLTEDNTGGYHTPMEAIVALLILVFMVSLFGNVIVVLIITKKKRMQTFTNWLLLNLAVADLLVALICIPLEIPLEIKKYWMYGEKFCTFFYPIQTATVYGSVFTLVGLSLSRYWAIIHPFKPQATVRHAKIVIALIWVLSLAFVIPYMTVLRVQDDYCGETWTATQRRIYTVATVVLQFLLPLFVISIAYTFIVYELKYSKATLKVDKIKRKETKKVVNLLLIITITFALCVLPYHTVGLVGEFYSTEFRYFEDINLASYLLLYINSCLNPIIYNVFNERFRETFKELYKTVIAYVCRRSQETESVGFFSSRRPSKLEIHFSASNTDRTSVTSNEGNRASVSFAGSPFLKPSSAYETSVKFCHGNINNNNYGEFGKTVNI